MEMCQTNRLDTSPSCFYRVFMIRNSVLIFLISFVAYGCATSHKNSHSQLVRGYIERGDYSFTTSLVKNENGQVEAVDVTGLIYNGTKSHFQCRCEFIQEYAEGDLTDVNWIGEEDINFDGIPDLMIYIGTNAVGRVSEFFDAYVWDKDKHSFVRVEQFAEIANPQFEADKQCITSTYRIGANEITISTYKWIENKLSLVNEEIEPIGE